MTEATKNIHAVGLGDLNGKHCGTCVHFNPYQPDSWRIQCTENRNYGSWCSKLTLTTAAELLRCGGHDYEERKR